MKISITKENKKGNQPFKDQMFHYLKYKNHQVESCNKNNRY